jgi:hypothetical protein
MYVDLKAMSFHNQQENKRPHIAKFHTNLFKGTIAVSTLGASITFQVVIQQIGDDADTSPFHTFHRKTARSFLAIAWVLFVVALGIACLAAILVGLREDVVKRDEMEAMGKEEVEEEVWYETLASATSGLLLFVMLSAFSFCSLAVTSYCEGAGWAGVGMSALFLVAASAIWIAHMS